HLRSATSSRSICPTRATGPPNPMSPSRRKYTTNSRMPTLGAASRVEDSLTVIHPPSIDRGKQEQGSRCRRARPPTFNHQELGYWLGQLCVSSVASRHHR